MAKGKPRRLKRERTKGWTKPAGAVICDRTSRWGNPYRVPMFERAIIDEVWNSLLNVTLPATTPNLRPPDAKTVRSSGLVRALVQASRDHARDLAIELHRIELEAFRAARPEDFEAWIGPLRGRDLVCFCDLGAPCHVDTLLQLANERKADG